MSKPNLGNNRLVALAADVHAAHGGVKAAAMTRAQSALAAGHALLEAKSLLKHGRWLPWLKDDCGLPERTAQLYMKLAKLGVPAEMVAVIGMEAAVQIYPGWGRIKVHSPDYDPFAHCDEEGRRQWLLFGKFIGDFDLHHIQWLLQQQYATPDEWLGKEGARHRQQMGMKQPAEAFRSQWAEFQRENQGRSLASIETGCIRRAAT